MQLAETEITPLGSKQPVLTYPPLTDDLIVDKIFYVNTIPMYGIMSSFSQSRYSGVVGGLLCFLQHSAAWRERNYMVSTFSFSTANALVPPSPSHTVFPLPTTPRLPHDPAATRPDPFNTCVLDQGAGQILVCELTTQQNGLILFSDSECEMTLIDTTTAADCISTHPGIEFQCTGDVECAHRDRCLNEGGMGRGT